MRRIIDFLIVAADLQWRAYRRQLTFKESCLTLPKDGKVQEDGHGR